MNMDGRAAGIACAVAVAINVLTHTGLISADTFFPMVICIGVLRQAVAQAGALRPAFTADLPMLGVRIFVLGKTVGAGLRLAAARTCAGPEMLGAVAGIGAPITPRVPKSLKGPPGEFGVAVAAGNRLLAVAFAGGLRCGSILILMLADRSGILTAVPSLFAFRQRRGHEADNHHQR